MKGSKEEIPIWLTWDIRENSWSLRAVDTSKGASDYHKRMVKDEQRNAHIVGEVRVEKRIANHCFGHQDILTLSEVKRKREEYRRLADEGDRRERERANEVAERIRSERR